MEWEEDDNDAAEDAEAGAPLLPPDDRLRRHPAEIAATRVSSTTVRTPWPRTLAIAGVSAMVGGLVVTAGFLSFGAGEPTIRGADTRVLEATDELHHDYRISDETWDALGEHWNDQQRMDLVFAVGQYTLVSMALRTFGVPLDDFLDGW